MSSVAVQTDDLQAELAAAQKQATETKQHEVEQLKQQEEATAREQAILAEERENVELVAAFEKGKKKDEKDSSFKQVSWQKGSSKKQRSKKKIKETLSNTNEKHAHNIFAGGLRG